MRRVVFLLCVLAWPHPTLAACTGASPTWTTSADYASVSACVAGAAAGDTIHVSAGTVTWTSTLTLTRGITLAGAGRDLLHITRESAIAIEIAPNATAIANAEVIRITGFDFNGNNTSSNYGIIHISVPLLSVWQSVVIGDCRFRNCFRDTIYTNGQARGVIYGNQFDRCLHIIRTYGQDSPSEWTAYGGSRAFGTANSLYFEDNTIAYSSAAVSAGATPGYTGVGQAGRWVCRYNTWDMTNLADDEEFWDVHGSQYNPGGQIGAMQSEYYGNTLIVLSPYQWSNGRGGWGLIFNNLATGGGLMPLSVNDLPGSCDTITGLPTQSDNYYHWNNTFNGSEVKAGIGAYNECPSYPIVENVRFFNLNTAFNGTTQHGIGRQTTTPVFASATAPHADANGQSIDGDAVWVASTATPTVNATVIQNGKLYKYISGSWQVYYTPYTYPHPLRGAGTAPAAATNVRVR